MSMFGRAVVAVVLLGGARIACAAPPAGDACAAQLAPDGKAIYSATMAARPTTDTLRATIEKEARSLAMAGRIARGSARDNALAAGECVKVALQ
jgi:hypothetical protein